MVDIPLGCFHRNLESFRKPGGIGKKVPFDLIMKPQQPFKLRKYGHDTSLHYLGTAGQELGQKFSFIQYGPLVRKELLRPQKCLPKNRQKFNLCTWGIENMQRTD
jgi:hypothetical protein